MTAVIVLVYVVGFILTLKHRVYVAKVRNEQTKWMEQVIGPRVMGRQGYRTMHLELLEDLRTTPRGVTRLRKHDKGDLAFRIDPYGPINQYPSDYPDIIAFSVLFPLYWAVWVPSLVLGDAFTSSVKKTPGQLQSELDEVEKADAARKLHLQRLEEEIERMRKEQDDF